MKLQLNYEFTERRKYIYYKLVVFSYNAPRITNDLLQEILLQWKLLHQQYSLQVKISLLLSMFLGTKTCNSSIYHMNDNQLLARKYGLKANQSIKTARGFTKSQDSRIPERKFTLTGALILTLACLYPTPVRVQNKL